jgi:hypothetical protein
LDSGSSSSCRDGNSYAEEGNLVPGDDGSLDSDAPASRPGVLPPGFDVDEIDQSSNGTGSGSDISGLAKKKFLTFLQGLKVERRLIGSARQGGATVRSTG